MKLINDISLKFKLGKYNFSNSNIFFSDGCNRFSSLIKTGVVKNFSQNQKSNTQNDSTDIISADEIGKKEKIRDITTSSFEEKSIKIIYKD